MLNIQNLSTIFPDGTRALSNINLTIERGEFLVIAGKNGSGKTVLMKHLNGLLKPTSGQVLLYGKPVLKHLVWARQMIGLVFQNPDSQFLGQTVEDDIAFGPKNLNLQSKEVSRRVNNALEETGLLGLREKLPHSLSGGEKQKCAIAGVLAMNPEIIIFDEPFTQLDFPGVQQVLEQIISLHRKGKTIIVITHDLEKVLAHATRLVILKEGHIVFDGLPEQGIETAIKFDIYKPYDRTRKLGTYTWLR
jgi:biotin transport system ATP-binding protein